MIIGKKVKEARNNNYTLQLVNSGKKWYINKHENFESQSIFYGNEAECTEKYNSIINAEKLEVIK